MKEKVSTKDVMEQINSIIASTNDIRNVVNSMPDCQVKKAFEYSIKNLDKKIAIFTRPSGRFKLSDEEKELVQKFREGKKEEVSQIPATKVKTKKH